MDVHLSRATEARRALTMTEHILDATIQTSGSVLNLAIALLLSGISMGIATWKCCLCCFELLQGFLWLQNPKPRRIRKLRLPSTLPNPRRARSQGFDARDRMTSALFTRSR